jgi:4-amino-4-deoxy-L-arabinose transferase-like glycosyltransferase
LTSSPPATPTTTVAPSSKYAAGPARALAVRLAHQGALAAVLGLAAVLNIHRLAQNGYANIFYSAGVKSMLLSLHNFLFVSFDPGGLITVDKPPLGLWVQALSAKLFGFSALSLLLPEAIAGVLAVAALYWAMAKPYGRTAALAGALVLAVFPSFVAVSRDNNLDALLILLMVLACGVALRAIESGRWRTLMCCAVLVGLAFNTKTLAAYLILPGIATAYLVCAPGSPRRRLTQLLAAGTLMAAISFSWLAFVELTPASQRPFVGGSTDNSEFGLTFAYNGFGRVGGQVGGPGRIPHAARRPAVAHVRPATTPVTTATSRAGRAKHPVSFGGPTGPLRLIGVNLGDQGGWLLPFAVFGIVALLISTLLAPASAREPSGEMLSGETDSARDRRDPRLAGLLVLGGWFLVEGLVLSLSKGIVHPYYVSALGPGAAAMVGAGAGAFVALSRRLRWRLALVPVAVAATVAVQLELLHRAHYLHWFSAVLILGAALGVSAFVALRRWAGPAMALTLGVLLLAPTAYATTTWEAPVEGTFPVAGPRQAAGYGGLGVSSASLRTNRALLHYLTGHRPGTRWAALTAASDTAAPLILLGLRAGAMGGYSGVDPALDGPGLARFVALGQARYVVLGGAYAGRGGNRASAAVQRACRVVPVRQWQSPPFRFVLVLYDCAGRAPQLSAAGEPRLLRPRTIGAERHARRALSRDRRPSAAPPNRRRRLGAARPAHR